MPKHLSTSYRTGVEAFMKLCRRLAVDRATPCEAGALTLGKPLAIQDVAAYLSRANSELTGDEQEGFDEALALYLIDVITVGSIPVVERWNNSNTPKGCPVTTTTEPRRRSRAAEQLDREIVREEWMVAGITQLPRRAKIDSVALEPDAYFAAVAAHWPATFLGYSISRWGYADFRLPLHWHIHRVITGHAELRDDKGRPRALLVENVARDDATLVLLTRIHTTLEADDEDGVRVATIDRATGRRMRVSPSFESVDHASIAHHRIAQSEWLLEVRPRHLDPFAYW
ncbi:hypothetical protein GIY62_14610 [Burkholderia plantarii]|uniref:hypothetical protein n=1 Tax=Burkholderia plantarii TaxID=41899 RepID=UPI00272AAA83|nr:hypothetical protein [Burkholderia plantarii]WLE58358.1 hypothetical protein GIY62_14610 [Burkholderia plantarii]